MCFDIRHVVRSQPIPSLVGGLPPPFLGYLSVERTARGLRDCHVQLAAVPASEREAADRFAALRWPGGWRCSGCGCRRYTSGASRPRQRRCCACGLRRSVTAGSSLARKHDLRRWFAAAMVLGGAQQGSALAFSEAWPCARNTAFTTMHLLRKCVPTPTEPPPSTDPSREVVVVAASARRDKRTKRKLPMNVGLMRDSAGALATVAAVVKARGQLWSTGSAGAPRGASDGEAAALAAHVVGVIDRVHRSVSPRWVERYRQLLVYRMRVARAGGCARTQLLALAAAGPPTPGRALVPS